MDGDVLSYQLRMGFDHANHANNQGGFPPSKAENDPAACQNKILYSGGYGQDGGMGQANKVINKTLDHRF